MSTTWTCPEGHAYVAPSGPTRPECPMCGYTPEEWLARLRAGDGQGLIPVESARALQARGAIRAITDDGYARAKRRSGSIMVHVVDSPEGGRRA